RARQRLPARSSGPPTGASPPGRDNAVIGWLPALGLVRALVPATVAPPADGRALMARFECARCHDGTSQPTPPRERHCVHCHRDILAGRFAAAADTLARWQSHLTSLRAVPSLTGAGATLRREWVRNFLLSPRDQRPALLATMPRLALQ